MSGGRRSAGHSGTAQGSRRNERWRNIYVANNKGLSNWRNVQSGRDDLGINELADWTMGDFVRTMIVGAMRHVESGKKDRHTDKEHEQERSFGSCLSFIHLVQPIRHTFRMPLTRSDVKQWVFGGSLSYKILTGQIFAVKRRKKNTMVIYFVSLCGKYVYYTVL